MSFSRPQTSPSLFYPQFLRPTEHPLWTPDWSLKLLLQLSHSQIVRLGLGNSVLGQKASTCQNS